MKKSHVKATAIVVCFSFLLLSFPGMIQASPRTGKYIYQRILSKPLAFFAEFFSYLPIFDYYPYQEEPQTVETRTYTNKYSPSMKTTGDINRGRLSEGD